MNEQTPPLPRSVATTAAAEPARSRRVLLVGWFLFMVLCVAALLASKASAQAAGGKPAAAKAPAAAAAKPGAAKVGAIKPKPAPARPKAVAPANKNYDTIELKESLDEPNMVRRMQSAAKRLVTERDIAQFPDLAYAKGYINTYVPAKITQPDATDQISSLVSELLQSCQRAQTSGTPGAAEYLRGLYFGMKKVAEGNYPPAARINATLAIGSLDSRAASGDSPPIPLVQSYPILWGLYQNTNNPEGVRAAALQGLRRQVIYGFPQLTESKNASSAPLVAEMKKLLDEPSPDGRSPKAHAFLQRYAVDILEMLAPENDPALAKTLVSLSTSPDQPELIALYSASKLGAMKTLKGQVDEPSVVLQSWSRRALNAYQGELARLNGLERKAPVSDQPPDPDAQIVKKAKPAARGGAGGMGGNYEDEMGRGMDSYEDQMGPGMDSYSMDDMGGMGMGMGYGGMGMTVEANPQPAEVTISRRKLNSSVEQLQRGVTGSGTVGQPKEAAGLLTAAANEASKDEIIDWIDTIAAVVTATNDPSLDTRVKYVKGLEEQIVILKALAGVVDENGDIDAPDATMPMMPMFPGMTAEPAAAEPLPATAPDPAAALN